MRIIILLCLVAISFSQPFDEDDPRAIIEKVRIYLITKELDLTSEQAVQFFPKLNELQKIEKEFRKKRADMLIELNKLLEHEAANQKILEVIREYENVHNKKIENQKMELKEMKKILSPMQQAKYLIFQEKFEREIRSLIKEVKKHRLRP